MYNFGLGNVIGERIEKYDIVQVEKWVNLPLKCNYCTILYWNDGTHFFDWETVDIMWWTGYSWGKLWK